MLAQLLLKRTFTLLLIVLMTSAVVGCRGQVRVDAISDAVGGPYSVTGRHDAYVQADEALNEIERSTYLTESATIVAQVEGAIATEEKHVAAGPLLPFISEVVSRHNAYIALDAALSEVATEIFIGEARLLHRVFQEADKAPNQSAIGEDSPLNQ